MTPEEIVNANRSLAFYHARRMYGLWSRRGFAWLDYNAIESAALYGLLRAASKWDGKRPYYLSVCITRRISQYIKKSLKAYGQFKTLSLDSLTTDKKGEVPLLLVDTTRLPDADAKEVTDLLLTCLTELERKVITALFFDGLTAVEVAKEMGVARQRVFKIKAQAIAKMREAVKEMDI